MLPWLLWWLVPTIGIVYLGLTKGYIHLAIAGLWKYSFFVLHKVRPNIVRNSRLDRCHVFGCLFL